MKPFKLFASCLPGLEPLLDDELARLGIGVRARAQGGVEFSGHASSVARVCHGSGLATRVLLRFDRFRATKFETLRRRIAEIPWEDYLRADEVFDVRADLAHCRLWHGGAVEERVALGVLDRLQNRELLESRAEAPDDARTEDAEDAVVLRVRGSGDRFGVSIDLGGAPLWRRGWRHEGAKAPLREDLAHALVLLSDWKPGAQRFVDPFCGSGTIAIEAACRARGLAPGRLRRFAFEKTALAPHARIEELRAQVAGPAAEQVEIYASDRDAAAIEAATRNAARAGVPEDIRFACCAFSDAEAFGTSARAAAVVTNPPFGARVAGGDLRSLHQRLGKLVAALPDATSLTLLTSDARVARTTGLALESALSTEHGGMRVQALRCAAVAGRGEDSEPVR